MTRHPLEDKVLLKFQSLMKKRLGKRGNYGDWNDDSLDALFYGLLEEVLELHTAIIDLKRYIGPGDQDSYKLAIIYEAADVANYAMSIADKVSSLQK